MAKEVRKCAIVSGAPESDFGYISENIDLNSFIIAADSGYNKLKALNINPDLVIGDFDSSLMPEGDFEIVKLPVEKEHTDTFAAVMLAVERGYNDITVYGAIGSRVDHTYSNILCLDYCFKNSVSCCIINKQNRISLIAGEKRINKEYKWFSLFAYLSDCKGVSIIGAHYTPDFYNKETIDINLGDQFAQSNFVENEYATVKCRQGTLLLIESND